MKKEMSFKLGDSVKVKKSLPCPDMEEFCIGGWQGRVIFVDEIEDGKILVDVEWDSVTLRSMPAEYIIKCEEEGLSYSEMRLWPEDFEPVEARDKKRDVKIAFEEIGGKYAWFCMGEEGKRIQSVIGDIDEDDEIELFEAWEEYLDKILYFPFEAEISEYQESRGPLQSGEKVLVKKFALVDDFYGILARVIYEGETFLFPLCDLEVIDENSINYVPQKDYCVWFANR